jgi:hypothetical protein
MGGGERFRLVLLDGLRSAEVARLCSGATGTSSSLSRFSLFMRLKVRGLGSPGTTFLLLLLFNSPAVRSACSPLECGLPLSLPSSSSGFSSFSDGGGSSSLFSHEPIFWKLRRSHTLLCSLTSERARCLLRLRLDSPLLADSKWGILGGGSIAHPPRWRRGVVAARPRPSYCLYQPLTRRAHVRCDRLGTAGAFLAGSDRLDWLLSRWRRRHAVSVAGGTVADRIHRPSSRVVLGAVYFVCACPRRVSLQI